MIFILLGCAAVIFGGGAACWWGMAPPSNAENPDIRNILNKKRNKK